MSEIKVNKISPRAACGTVQLGDSGDTFTIPAGATINNQGTATNFGATGSASWVTTVKTGDFTAVAGEGYFVNTTSGEIDVALPAGTAGAVVAVKDYAKTWQTNNCILVPNGSDKIGGLADNAILAEQGLAVTLVFVDSTKGWLVTDSGLQSEAPGILYVAASGGTETTSGDFKIHTFTGPGTFTVSCAGNAQGSNKVSYMVVAGGGSGGAAEGGGGGGAGGFRESKAPFCSPYTASPLAPTDGLAVEATAIPITVGAGGASLPYPAPTRGNAGSNSIFSTITSAGGGGGGTSCNSPTRPGGNGGSGGGGGETRGGCGQQGTGGSGNTPSVSPAQGKDGGPGSPSATNPAGAGGGGGATACGQTGQPNAGGAGGAGATTSINGTPTARAGGGGGGVYGPACLGAGGTGGGGAGGRKAGGSVAAVAGTVNTGGGGGGASEGSPGSYGNSAAGGSGIVIIRYKFQN